MSENIKLHIILPQKSAICKASRKKIPECFLNIRVKSYRFNELKSSLSLSHEGSESDLVGNSDFGEHLAV